MPYLYLHIYCAHCRYLDICLGLILLVSMLCLLYGTYSQSPHFLILFFILSLVVVIGYWTWYVYVNFVSQDSPVFEDQVNWNLLHNIILYVWHYIFRLAKLVWSWPFCFVSCLCRSWCSTDTLSWREPPWPPPWRGRGGRSGAQTPQNIPRNMKTVSPIHGGIFNLNILHLITFFNRFWTSLMKVLLILLMIHTFKSKI